MASDYICESSRLVDYSLSCSHYDRGWIQRLVSPIKQCGCQRSFSISDATTNHLNYCWNNSSWWKTHFTYDYWWALDYGWSCQHSNQLALAEKTNQYLEISLFIKRIYRLKLRGNFSNPFRDCNPFTELHGIVFRLNIPFFISIKGKLHLLL